MTDRPTSLPAPLHVEGLAKSFRGRRVLAGVSFVLDPGTVTVVGGINGSGKTTLLRCIAGLARCTGRVQLGGHELGSRAGRDARRLIGYLPQAPGFPESGTVAELLDLFGTLRGAPLGTVPLPPGFLPPPDARLGTLSGGQQQRVALTVALLGAPRLVLLDEPVANLDRDARHAAWDALDQLRGSGGTVLVASPTPAELLDVADRVLELDCGTIVRDVPARSPASGRAAARLPSQHPAVRSTERLRRAGSAGSASPLHTVAVER